MQTEITETTEQLDGRAPRVPLRPGPRSSLRRLAAVLSGSLAGGITAWLVGAQVLRGLPALVVMAMAGLAMPTSRELARRALIAGCVFLGWVPVTWWWRLPVGAVGHFGLLLGLMIGALVAWVVWPSTRSRLRLLRPRLRWADAVLAVAVAGAVWIYAPGLQSVSPEVELSRFFGGWDNVAHFDMTEMIRRFGVMVVHAPTGSLGDWTYGPYPQGFHAVTATVMEAIAGVGAAAPAVDLVAYGRALTMVVIGALATVVAGVCSLPALRRRPLLALPLAMFVIATFGLGPGGLLVHEGFPNFYVAVALLCCLPLIGVQMSKPGAAGLLVALVGATVGVAHNWALLLTMGMFAAAVSLGPFRRSRWPRLWTEWALAAVPTAIGALWLVVAWSMLRQNPPLGDILVTRGGGITLVPDYELLLSSVGALGMCALAALRVRMPGGPTHHDDVVRLAWLAPVLLAGLVVSALIAKTQIARTGEVGYYFWKYAIAMQIVSVVILCCAVAVLAPQPRRISRWSVGRGGSFAGAAVVSLLVTAGVVQAYGTPHNLPTTIGGGVAPGISARSDYASLNAAPVVDAVTLIAAVRADDDGRVAPAVYAVPAQSGQLSWMLLAQWYYSLTGRWTVKTDSLMRAVHVPPVASDVDFAVLVKSAVRAEPDAVVVIPPSSAEAVRRLLEPDGLSDRVISW